jgi:hypothetical protein
MAINIPLVVDFNGKGIQKAVAEFKKLETAGAKATFAIQKAALPAAAALGGLALAATSAAKAAIEDEQAQVLLAGQLMRTTGATQAQVEANEAFIESVSKSVAVADDELRPALSTLVTGTKNLATAQRLLGVALNTSAATGVSLQTVSEALSRGFNGNTRQLGQLSPELKTLIKEGASFSDVLTVLEKNFGGAAEAAANTTAGGLRGFQIAIDEAKESIGSALIPVIARLTPILRGLADFAGRNAALIGTMAVALGALSAAVIVVNGALAAYKAIGVITTLVNTALATSFTAVQVATVVGIATAVAGTATFITLASKIKGAIPSVDQFGASVQTMGGRVADASVELTKAELALANFVGPLNPAQAAVRQFASEVLKAKEAAAKLEREKAAAKAATAAAAAANKAKTAFESLKGKLGDARQSLREYAKSLADTVSGYVSLSNAVKTADDREKDYNDALAERAAAYAELNKLQASGVASTEQLADAAERVAKAETAVTAAQSQRTSYSAQFREQIAAAKKFAGHLQTLIGQGLSRAGLAQLMNLGPVAGAQVAEELISGAGGMTAASLSADLAGLDLAGAALGESAISSDMALLNQAGVGRSGNNVYITVQGGDPQQVVEALRRYMKINGAVPIKVTNK